MSFDSDDFLDWLSEQDGPVKKQHLLNEWPDFPWLGLGTVTGPIVEGDYAYYKRDLKRAARGVMPRD